MNKGMSTKETKQLDHQKIVGFKTWYSDSTYTSNDGKWNDAPKDDVQMVMVYFAHKDALKRFTRLYSSGCDYYALDGSTGRFSSSFDDVSSVSGHVLYGKFMNWDSLMALEKVAFEDYGEWLNPKELKELIN